MYPPALEATAPFRRLQLLACIGGTAPRCPRGYSAARRATIPAIVYLGYLGQTTDLLFARRYRRHWPSQSTINVSKQSGNGVNKRRRLVVNSTHLYRSMDLPAAWQHYVRTDSRDSCRLCPMCCFANAVRVSSQSLIQLRLPLLSRPPIRGIHQVRTCHLPRLPYVPSHLRLSVPVAVGPQSVRCSPRPQRPRQPCIDPEARRRKQRA